MRFRKKKFSVRRPDMMIKFEGCVGRIRPGEDTASANNRQVDQRVIDLYSMSVYPHGIDIPQKMVSRH